METNIRKRILLSKIALFNKQSSVFQARNSTQATEAMAYVAPGLGLGAL